MNRSGDVVVNVDDQIEEEVVVLKRLTSYYIIERPSLAILQRGQRQMIRELADLYMNAIGGDTRVFPLAFLQRLEAAETADARKRVVTDLIAGMTEESAAEVYRRAIGIARGSLLSAPDS